MKKYAKVFRKWAIKDKLTNAEARLVTWLNTIWEFVRDHSVRTFSVSELFPFLLVERVLVYPVPCSWLASCRLSITAPLHFSQHSMLRGDETCPLIQQVHCAGVVVHPAAAWGGSSCTVLP